MFKHEAADSDSVWLLPFLTLKDTQFHEPADQRAFTGGSHPPVSSLQQPDSFNTEESFQ